MKCSENKYIHFFQYEFRSSSLQGCADKEHRGSVKKPLQSSPSIVKIKMLYRKEDVKWLGCSQSIQYTKGQIKDFWYQSIQTSSAIYTSPIRNLSDWQQSLLMKCTLIGYSTTLRQAIGRKLFVHTAQLVLFIQSVFFLSALKKEPSGSEILACDCMPSIF